MFRIIKLYEEIGKINSSNNKMVEKEPIDLFMKYIDLTDKNLKREGIKQIYKDFDNEELRYSLRSIDEYILRSCMMFTMDQKNFYCNAK